MLSITADTTTIYTQTGVLHGGQAEWDGRIFVGSIVLYVVGGWHPDATPLSKHIIRGLAVSAAVCVFDVALLLESSTHVTGNCAKHLRAAAYLVLTKCYEDFA